MTDNETSMIVNTLAMAKPVDVFLGLTLVTKALATVALLAGGLALVLALIRVVSQGRRSGALATTGLVGLISAALGAAYPGLNSAVAFFVVRPTHLLVLLPSAVEVTYVLILGLIVWVIAKLGNAGAASAR